jgi:hypothetical protein
MFVNIYAAVCGLVNQERHHAEQGELCSSTIPDCGLARQEMDRLDSTSKGSDLNYRDPLRFA